MRAVLFAPIALALTTLALPALAQPVPRPGLEPTAPSGLISPASVVMPLVLEGPAVPAAAVADAPTQVGVIIRRLKPGTRASVTSVLAPAGPCRFVTLGTAPLPSATAGSDGVASLSIPGVFANTGAATGPCTVKATFSVTRQDGEVLAPTLESSRVALAAPAVYLLADTADWATKFGFHNTASDGDCTGSSSAIGGGIYRVGLISSENSVMLKDLTFRVRSGPFGTKCTWKSEAIVLPQGVKVTEMAVSMAGNGKCTARVAGTTTGRVPGGSISYRSVANPVTTASGDALVANPGGAGNPITVFLPLTAYLECDATATNDKFANVTIDSITFSGPPGLTFP